MNNKFSPNHSSGEGAWYDINATETDLLWKAENQLEPEP